MARKAESYQVPVYDDFLEEITRMDQEYNRATSLRGSSQFDVEGASVPLSVAELRQVLDPRTLPNVDAEVARRLESMGESEEDEEMEPREPFSLSRFVMRNTVRGWLVGMVGVALAQGIASTWGRSLAYEALEDAQSKIAISVGISDGSTEKTLGYISPPGGDESVRGIDSSLPVPPEFLESGGPAHAWYLGIQELEDNQHDERYSDAWVAWSDWLGLHSRMPYTVLSGQGGGSSLSNQAYDSATDGFSKYNYMRGKKGWLQKKAGFFREKADATIGGMGLATEFSPTEVAAILATFVYLAPDAEGLELFVRTYWDFEGGLQDERMNAGRQLVLAAMSRYPWNSKDDRWARIETRAKLAADRLVEKGFLSPKDVKTVYRQIEEAKPLKKSELKHGVKATVATKPAHKTLLAQAALEMSRLLGPDWRTKARRVNITANEAIQEALVKSCNAARRKVDSSAHCMGWVLDAEGQILAMHVSDGNLARITQERSFASWGKLFIAEEVARSYYAEDSAPHYSTYYDDAGTLQRRQYFPGEPWNSLTSFRTNFAWSRDSVIKDAKALGVNPRRVHDLIDCYGTPYPGERRDSISDAVLGNFSSTFSGFSAFLHASVSDSPLPTPYVVESYVDREGRTIRVNPLMGEWASCAQSVRNNGRTEEWFGVPLEGTLSVLAGYARYGKTGTACALDRSQKGWVCGDNGATNAAWAIAGREYGYREDYTVLVGLAADRPDQNIGNKVTGGTHAAPIARYVLATLNEERWDLRKARR